MKFSKMCKFHGEGQIPPVGSKFRGPLKTVHPANKRDCEITEAGATSDEPWLLTYAYSRF